jgi:glycosyltransferase involved in cell wall biosynthesis
VLDRTSFAANFNPWLLRADTPRWIRRRVGRNPTVKRLWSELQELRESKSPSAGLHRVRSPGPDSRPRIAVVSGYRNAFTETFVQAHIRGVPARVDWILQDKQGRHYSSDELPLCSMRERLLRASHEALGNIRSKYDNDAVARFLRRRRVQAVLAEFGPIAARVLPACSRSDIPLIAHFHGYDASVTAVLEDQREDYVRLFNEAAAVVVVSRDMERKLIELGAAPEKIHFIPCSVAVTDFHGADPASAPPLFLAAGRYVEKKAPHLLLLAFARVLAACPEARLLMVGDGPLRGACEDLARGLGIDHAIEFAGFLPHTMIAARMRNVRGFTQHSVTARDGNAEGTPVSLLEASASGLPVLATRHAGIKDAVLHGQTGFLVDPHDVEGMAEYWIRLVREPALAGELGLAGREYIQASLYERNRSIDRLWRVIERSMTAAGGDPSNTGPDRPPG